MELSEGYRFHVQFHITNRCNLKCRHCYEGVQTGCVEWSYEDFTAAIDKLWACFHKWNVRGEISLIGGEPTCHPEFYRFVRYLHARGDIDSISVLTNGVRLDDRFIGEMKDGGCFVQVSIDGADEEHHDYIRGAGNYERSMKNIALMAASGIPMSAHCVLSKYTYPITPAFFEVLHANGIGQVTFSRLVPFGHAQRSDMLSPDELRDAFDVIARMKEKFEAQGLGVAATRPLWCLYGYGGSCPAGIQTITILENGDIMPCRRLPIVLGNIKEDNFYKIWYTNGVLEDLRNRRALEKCGGCAHVGRCGGARCIAYAVTGDYMAADPQCWVEI